MFAGLNFKFIFAGVLVLAVMAIITVSYNHYTNLVEQVSILETDKAKLEVAVTLQNNTISAQKTAIEEWDNSQKVLVQTLQSLQDLSIQASNETRQLNELFSKRDFGDLAASKPTLIENRINSGSARIGRLLECASGSADPDCGNSRKAPSPIN